MPKTSSRYESLCNLAEKIITIKPNENTRPKLEKAIEITHLDISPNGATSLAVLAAIFLVLIAILLSAGSYLLSTPEQGAVNTETSLNEQGTGTPMLFFPLILIILAAVILKPLSNAPIYFANKWRLKASNQMVLCVLYIVMYMRHTSNLEHAIKFATEHIGPPLSLDFRKVFWDIETGKYSTIKESLNAYLENWRDYNLEFVNSFHLIESSLLEPSEERRIQLLDKALDVMLTGTYEKMLHYAQELKNPITMLHMLGVILPILGLIIFPLVSSFMGGLVKWYHLALLYDVILPLAVFTFGYDVLSKRPTGYGESSIEQDMLKEKKSKFFPAIVIILFCFVGLSPLFLHAAYPNQDYQFYKFGNFSDFRCDKIVESGKTTTECIGPFGLGAVLLSLFFPLGLALGLSIYYKGMAKDLVKMREETKSLEKEFASSLFQLGNRLEDGIPAELAVGTVAQNMSSTPTGDFFRIVSVNIRNLGMNLKEAIFNEKTGAILSYPSTLVQSSMEVLLESVKKGPRVAARSLISISNYVDEIHRVNERLKDLLTEIVSSMKSQISFMAPVIAGIVVGIGSMISGIIANMSTLFGNISSNAGEGATIGGNIMAAANLFKVKDIIPSFYFQLVVGVYVVEIIYILTILANGIENGPDKLNEKYLLGKNLFRGAMLYFILAFVVIFLFNLLASTILGSSNLTSGLSSGG
ncbi:MAG: hypothetical protein PHD81_02155 [Candidatus Nanoarchaeia archaeon]|nr:hypothetical protein [Candidatus Nanoarchaeia archaeon]MDD5587893.1 hypothetical protein [Candidatus Nanoarchaeia archaeon]